MKPKRSLKNKAIYSRKKRLLINIGLLLVSILLALIIIEIMLRAINYEYHPLSIRLESIVNHTDWRASHAFRDVDTIYDKNLLWRPSKDSPAFNSQGFIGSEINKSNFDYYKIFTLGDSNTAGPREDGTKGWPSYVEFFLKGKNPELVVVNAGVWGYTSYQGLERFKEILPFKPNMILVSFGSNDAHMVKIPDKKWRKANANQENSFLSEKLKNLSFSFRTYQLLMSVSDKARLLLTHNQTLVHRVSPDDYRANLVEMISIAREDNITVVLLTRPFIYDVPGQRENPDPYWWKTYGPLYNNITLSVGKEYNITVVDIYAYFDNKTEFFADESHFSEEGNRLAASIIAEEVKKIMEHETKNK